MRILLTGASGNLGQALRRVPNDHTWTELNRDSWPQISSLVADADVVIHAASDLTTPVADRPGAVMEANLMTTTQLLENWPKHTPRRLVFISSCAVYGRSELTAEADEVTPLSVNGITKLLNEKIITEFCVKHEIPFQILRVFNIFGGVDRFSILSHLRRAVVGQKPFIMFNRGISQRDFVHVDDVAQTIVKLLQMPIQHRLMNVGSGEAVRIREIVAEVQRRHPELEVTHRERNEAEYSRANLERMRALFPNYEFRSVLDYIREDLSF